MGSARRIRFRATLGVAVAVIVGMAASQSWAAAPGAALWNVVHSPNRGADFNRLDAVSAASATDAWAVGLYRKTQPSEYRTLIEHFDGIGWSKVRSPSPGSSNQLMAVSAATATEAWAVGQQFNDSYGETLALHYDGTGWSAGHTPNRGANNVLRGVAEVSPDDVWAVGSSFGTVFNPLALHFNGTSWKAVSAPTPPGGGFFTAVVAIASDDVWAVGGVGDDGDDTLAEHWNGHHWTIAATPFTIREDEFLGVSAGSSNDVWAVGHVGSSTLTEHYDGSAWSVVPSPDPLPANANNFLTGVVELTPGNVWAVGGTLDFPAGSLIQTATLHYDGSSWSVVASPDRGSGDNSLLGVAALGPGSLVAAGSYRPTRPAYDRTLIMTTEQA